MTILVDHEELTEPTYLYMASHEQSRGAFIAVLLGIMRLTSCASFSKPIQSLARFSLNVSNKSVSLATRFRSVRVVPEYMWFLKASIITLPASL